ncbi:MAG: tetratricopeptide repeat protein [Planctomycetota bacterium]
MALFSKSKKGSSEDKGPGDDGAGFKRSLRKANTFFDYGNTAADSKNFDYAVECYVGGLRHNPDSMDRHEKLHDIAKRRSVNGGKPMKAKPLGPSLVDKMLRAEKMWACDWNNVLHMADVMEAAVEANNREGEEANLAEVANWVAELALQYNANPNGKPNRRVYLRIVDAMEKINKFDPAIQAAQRALMLREDDNLRSRIKDLTAQRYTYQSATNSAEGGSRANLKDAEDQAAIQAGLDTSGSKTDQLIAAMREPYDENPEDLDRLQKLVDALSRSEQTEHETEAVKLLLLAHEQSGQYRYKVKAGDLKLKQINRALRTLNDKAKAGDEAAKAKLQEGLKKRLAFELKEFGERAQNYPTDLKLKFELAKRQYQAGQFEDAIGNFQEATREPKSRSQAHLFLGRCFMKKGWMDEAMSTIERGLEQHADPDDVVGKELRYDLLVVMTEVAKEKKDLEVAKKAQAVASELLQTDINYKDIREKMDIVRSLVDELK